MQSNRATIYSAGIADFQRAFQVVSGKPNPISIPVRQEHLGDVLASLMVSGAVTIVSPPSYQPANQDDGNISIDTDDALVSLATQLVGAEVTIHLGGKTQSGRLVGVQEQEMATGGEPMMEKFLVVQSASGLSQFSIRQVDTLAFDDEAVQAEISKALSRQLREIKPNSTFVDLELATDEAEATAIIQYTIPAAAWKISYRLVLGDGDLIEFHGHAIVDNNTDEDWKDFVVAVVMGQPISFTTDLAESKIPQRNHVNIVQASALGAVEVEEPMPMPMAMAAPAVESRMLLDADLSSSSKKTAPGMARKAGRPQSATVETGDVTETGDFCVFESAGPVSIDAHRSAVIPVFQTTLDQSQPVLHFKAENHPERPYRSIRFKNSTEHSLGRGVCTVYDDLTYAGSCILPATKPGGDALLPHALETGVRVRVDRHPHKSKLVALRISEGVVYESHHEQRQLDYLINSSRDEAYTFMIDHDQFLRGGEYEVTLVRDGAEPETLAGEKLKAGVRIEFQLLPREVAKVVVVESKTNQSRVALLRSSASDKMQVDWLTHNLIEANHSLAEEAGVLACLQLQSELDQQQRELGQLDKEVSRLAKRQERLRENIKTGSANQHTARWQNDLASVEDQIVELEETQRQVIETKIAGLRERLFESLKALALEWTA